MNNANDLNSLVLCSISMIKMTQNMHFSFSFLDRLNSCEQAWQVIKIQFISLIGWLSEVVIFKIFAHYILLISIESYYILK